MSDTNPIGLEVQTVVDTGICGENCIDAEGFYSEHNGMARQFSATIPGGMVERNTRISPSKSFICIVVETLWTISK